MTVRGRTAVRPNPVASDAWTVEMLREYLQRQIDDLRMMLDERYATQTKALDAAFASQQIATQTAILSQERAVQTAMSASEKAVAKAETAAEKRFEALNEFRGAVQDIVSQQMPRGEAEARFTILGEKISELKTVAAGSDGSAAGSRVTRTEARLDRGATTALAAIIVSAVAVVTTIVVAVATHR
jgi:hypothetical protein